MYRKFSIPVGVAMLAALALVGMLGIFAFNAAQPAQADGIASATVMADPATPMATATYTITVMTNATLVEDQRINITPPGTLDDGVVEDVTVDGAMASTTARNGAYNVTLPMAVASGSTLTIVIPGVMNPAAGSHTWMVDSQLGDPAPASAMVMIGEDDGETMPEPMTMRMDSSVDARPKDPGDLAQITVKFTTTDFLAIDESITLEVSDDFGVPSSISASDVSISGMGAESATDPRPSPESASPRSVIVETDSVAERYVITLNIGNMDDSADRETDKGLADGPVTVVFRQGAGLTNRTEGGKDKWYVKTSEEDLLDSLPCVPKNTAMDCEGDNVDLAEGQIATATVYTVPHTISLSSYADSRGEEITAIGKGFKNGTTTRFWRDANNDGTRDTNETVLCDAVANGDDIAECKFTLFAPPFKPGFGPAGNMNYVNAIDGRGKTATMPLKRIELEPSISVNPKRGIPGDSINIQLHDFQTGDMVTQIEFARTVDICGGDSSTACADPPYNLTGTVGDNGTLSFSFDIPTTVAPGAQDLRVHTTNGDDNTTFIVGAGELQLSATNVLPNQRISISGSGFTKSSNQRPAYIGRPDTTDHSCLDSSGNLRMGTVTLDGDQIPWDRVNDNDGIEVTSGGTWSAPVDLPVSASTTSAGTRELKIIDCRGGVATIDLTFAEREVTMTPAEGGVGTEVVITGKNYPVSNDDGSDIDVEVEYDADVDTDDDDVEPDAVGNFTVILEVPEDAGIPSNNTVSVRFKEDDGSEVLDTFTHRVPQGTVAFSATRGGEGSSLTINADGFARYTRVDLVEFGDREITPTPNPSTDTSGNAEFTVRIPGSDPGIYIIRVEIDTVVATSTFTVVSGSGAADATVETVLANVISEDALDRIFRFDNTTKMWEWYISDPAFASTNNLGGLSSGDLVYIKVTKDVTADILGASTTLTCTNAGTDTEDCWNLIAIP